MDASELLGRQDPAIADLARKLCAEIEHRFPEAVITVDEQNIGYGTGTGYKGLVFTVAPASKHVTLGIAGGASLPDPAGLMEGGGKVHRHVKIRTAADLAQPELAALLDAALARVSRP